MGMPISNSSAVTGAYQAGGVNNMQQRRQSFDALTQALQSGDLASAQKAYATLVQSTPGASNNPNSPLAKIGQALQSGDIAGAQSAMTALKSARHGGHHHHGNGEAASSSAGTRPPTTSPGSVGSTLNIAA